ncbi:unnamed protein product [Bursaphelenchus okinawaensis]|uniref:Innexin n=1 Tax=Bursaphelenchus okinawaensis TaxID=465554 RepID=A0A811JSK1_9BILA|nr:unnamed protein product [Bursaphelenchus okinawaensis]CAG9081718.1 unnamed protein product [Bursaphelenchus okinawaensis]
MLGIPFLDDAVSRIFKPHTFDDPIDRLNYFITASLLAFFAIMVSAKQYVGAPIQCWMPMEFKGGWEQYAEDYCFIQNTYYVPMEEEIPQEISDRDERQFGYYQWVPVVLALQAFMFYIPNWIWKTLHQQSGLDLSTAITDAQNIRSMKCKDKHEESSKLSQYLCESLEINEVRQVPRTIFCMRFGRSLGSFVSMLYLFIKLMYLVNVFSQFVLLNNFIGRGFHLWGWTALQTLWTGGEWTDSPVFPRVSMCDFRVRRLANMHRYTVQCVLMINMFNEKIYLFIWFWFMFVAISTSINFLYCLSQMLPPRARENTIRKMLKRYDDHDNIFEQPSGQQVISNFVNNGLRPDGVLLLRFIEGHAGAIVARDICNRLFKEYLKGLQKDLQQRPYLAPPSSHSTKSTSPGVEESYGRVPLPEYQEKLLQPDSAFSLGKPKYV